MVDAADSKSAVARRVGSSPTARTRYCPARALGARFDIRDYNDAVVTTGGSPLAVLETVVGRYIAETLKA